jgi:PadR family transcriptional regulator PadR
MPDIGADQQLLTHLRRGTLEYCVLATLTRGERYAGDLISDLGGDATPVSSEGTVYPLLARLRRDGMVESSWRESSTGPPRRYYQLTARGENAVRRFHREWDVFSAAVDRILKEEKDTDV